MNTLRNDDKGPQAWLIVLSFGLFLWASYLIAVSAALLFLYQIYQWLRTGSWVSISILDAIKYLFPDEIPGSWIDQPNDWLGIHEIVIETLNLSAGFGVLVLAGLTFYIGFLFIAAIEKVGDLFGSKKSDKPKT